MKAIVDHDARVYSRWVNGSESTYYHATPSEIVGLINTYSQIRLREHVVTIEAGPKTAKSFDGDQIAYNVSYHHLGGISRFMMQDEGEPTTNEPTLMVYVDPQADRTWWEAAEISEHLVVNTQLANWPTKATATKPTRRDWHARVLFEGEEPAADFENGLSTKVTLWGADDQPGFDLGKVNHMGEFGAAFSDEEIAKLKSGKMWLTLTVGNYLVAARPDHPKLEFAHLSPSIEEAKAVELAKAQYYYGRLLFDDGTSPVIDPKPWAGAKILVVFPYTGQVSLDNEGYFKVFFTPEQFQDLKNRTARLNVYIPSYGKEGQSYAAHTYPATSLSLDKAQAGIVKIPRPRR